MDHKGSTRGKKEHFKIEHREQKKKEEEEKELKMWNKNCQVKTYDILVALIQLNVITFFVGKAILSISLVVRLI